MSEQTKPNQDAGGFLPPGPTLENLQALGGPDGPLFSYDNVEPLQYPNYIFYIKLDHINSGVIEATPASRSRYWSRIVADTCRADHPELAVYTLSEERAKQTTKIQKYLVEKVRILEIGKVSRQEVVDRQAAINSTLGKMRSINHPATQFLDQVEQTEEVKPTIVKELGQDIAVVVGYQILENYFEDQIAAINTPKKEPAGPPNNV